MGMFDYIRCEKPLPDGFAGELQTKDFGCEMVTHVITSDGRLMLDDGHNEIVPEEDRPYYGTEKWDHPLFKICGSVRRVPKYIDANFHGIVYFGGLETIGFEPDERWGPRGRPIYKGHDYRAKFTDGNLVGIEIGDEP
jgi:hypothetical protein